MMTVEEGVTAYGGDLQRYARSLVGPHRRADAEDLVQSCVVRALERAEQYQLGTNLKGWLFTVMRSQFISERRHDKICRRHAESIVCGPAKVTQPVQYHHVLLCETERAMGKLGAGDLGNLLDMAIGEASQESVAIRLNVPVGTIKSRLSRSRRKLRHSLDLEKGVVSNLVAA